MLKILKKALGVILIFTVLTGVIYPTIVTVVAQTFFADKANGSLIEKDGEVVASKYIGQNFTSDKYFRGRPSATAEYPYNTLASTGSNKSPASDEYEKVVQERIEYLQDIYGSNNDIPVDLVTASASGVDPDISIAAMEYQVDRVAKARNMSSEEVLSIANDLKEERVFGIFGEPHINVVELNLALDNYQNE